jgi:hypothetical protein
MIKDIELLSLNKSVDTKNLNTNKNETAKKEGLSLFDSLVINSKKEVELKSTKEELPSSSTKSLETKSSIKKTEENKESKPTFNQSSETKDSKIEKSDSENTKKIETKNKNPEDKNPELNKTIDNKVVNNTKTSSLLDRMILEANKQTKTINTSEKTVVNNTENIKTSDKSGIQNNKASSLLDKLISEAKIVIKNETSGSSKENIDEDTKIDTKDKSNLSKSIEANIKDNIPNQEKNSSILKDQKESIKENTKIEIKELKQDSKEVIKEVKQDSKDINLLEIKESKKVDNSSELAKEKLDVKVTDLKKESVNISEKSISENLNSEILKEDNKLKQADIKESTPTQKIINIDAIDNRVTNKLDRKIEQEVKLDNTINVKNEKVEVPKNTNENTLTESSKKVKNEVVANELLKLNSKTIETDSKIDININKKDLLSTSKEEVLPKNEQSSKSLMDRLLDNAKNTTLSTKDSVPNENLKTQTNNIKSNDVVSNIFLSNQKNSIYNQMLSTKSEGIKVVKEAKSTDDIKRSAEILDLGLKKTSVDIETPIENNKTKNVLEKESLIDKLAFSRNIRKDEHVLASASSSSQINTTTNTSNNEVVTTLNVSPSLALSIQNRIVGAQQHMSAMMSEAARNMYQNYKPPVTAFRINLFPSQLGTIAILMKNDKENSISISLNMSSSSTLDAFVDNQTALKDALSKNFNNSQTNFTLDFNMQDQSQNQSSNNQEEKNKKGENLSSSDVLESINENKDIGENLNYL